MSKSEQARADAACDAETLARWGGPWAEPERIGSWVIAYLGTIQQGRDNEFCTLDHARRELIPLARDAARAAFRAVPELRG